MRLSAIALGAGTLVFSFFLACGTCLSEVTMRETRVTLQCSQMELKDCAKLLQDKTRIMIFVPSKFANAKVSISVTNSALPNLIDDIASQLELKDYAVQFDEKNKTIYFSIIGEDNKVTNAVAGTIPLPSDMSAINGAPPSTNPTTEKPSLNVDDMEVLPPLSPGKRGMTRKELNEYDTGLQKIMAKSQDWECVPPTEPGGKGITRRQLEANQMKYELEAGSKPPFEAFPPSQPGGKGLTLEQLNAQQNTEPMQLPQSSFPPEMRKP